MAGHWHHLLIWNMLAHYVFRCQVKLGPGKVWVHNCIHIYMHDVCVCVKKIHVYILYSHIHMHVCMHVCKYVCMCIDLVLYTYIHMYTVYTHDCVSKLYDHVCI